MLRCCSSLSSSSFFLFLLVFSTSVASDSNDVDALQSAASIAVDVSGRNLTHLPPLDPSTVSLNASLNRLATIAAEELKRLPRLETLVLRCNNLSTLHFLPEAASCRLRTLDVSRNAVASLDGPLATCARLQSLNLTANALTALPPGVFAAMGELRVLYLAGNKLRVLEADAFAGARSLQRLRLNGNALATLPDALFKGLHALQYVDVSLNNLTRFPVFQECCEGLQGAYVRNNSIAWASEATLRQFLKGNASTARDASGNPLRPSSLAWAARDPQLRLLVHDDDCACGLLHQPSTRASLKLCVAVTCGATAPGANYANWVAAVRTAALPGADPVLVDALALAAAATVPALSPPTTSSILTDPTVPSDSALSAVPSMAPFESSTNASAYVVN